ncbi:hypothetical protein P153DRAFT_252835, partial [Dothidotthia symphoricarpi CBS 119687]
MRAKSDVLLEHYGVDYEEFQSYEYHVKWFNERMKDRPIDPPLEHWVKMKFPYEAPEHPPLPSMEEISHGMVHSSIAQNVGLHPVCRLGDCVVKQGREGDIFQEAENLLYLQEHSQVRTPKLYAAFLHHLPDDPVPIYYIITEYLEGATLTHKLYSSLGDEEQEALCARISEQFMLLRSVPSEGYYGRVYYQGVDPMTSIFRLAGKGMNGPYNT